MALVPLNSAEENNDTSWYTAGAAGIASGILKVPEGIFSLAAELIDLGLDTDSAGKVEQFFDTLNPFEEVAEKHGAGKLTEALVSIGVPSTAGFKLGSKLANKALKARRTGTSFSVGNKNAIEGAQKASRLNKLIPTTPGGEGAFRFAAGVAGGAAGETMVADIEEIGTFGDMFESAPTALDRTNSEGREDATRKLMNRFKFASEGLLITPFVAGAAKGGKALAKHGKELAYSNSKFERWVNKVASSFTPSGKLTTDLFESQKVFEQMKASDIDRATGIVRSLTKAVDKAFPQIQKVKDKLLSKEEKKEFYKDLNDLLFEGDISRGTFDPKKLDEIANKMKRLGVDDETSGLITQKLEEARAHFSELVDMTKGKNKTELTDILKDRISKMVGNTYAIFEDKPIMGLFNRYTPTNESKERAINYFMRQMAKKDAATRPISLGPVSKDKYYQDARQLVNNLLDEATKVAKAGDLPNFEFINRTLGDAPGGAFIKGVMEKTGQPPKVIRELFGEIKDPRLSIFNAVTHLSALGRQTQFLDEVYETNTRLQANGERGAFWGSKEEALRNTNRVVDVVEISGTSESKEGKLLADLGKVRGASIVNPLEGLWTTKDIADGLALSNNLRDTWLTSFAKGREGASAAEQGASWLYRNLLLIPKGASQLAKTVLSVPTHIRNFMSAGAFAGANGILFEGLTDPKALGNAFREGAQISGIFRGAKKADMEKAYRELLELGIVNQQIQVGDMKNLFRTAKFGDDIGNVDAVLNPMLSRLKSIPKWLQGKYVAEDDFWKITNHFVEMSRRAKAYEKAGIKDGMKVIDFAGQEKIYGKDFLRKESAHIVKNTVPNYAYVGDVVKTARILPVGNFMSFPSEMIRTTAGIGNQIVRELKHIPAKGVTVKGSNITPWVTEVLQDNTTRVVKNNNPMYGIGVQRALGMATTLTVVPTATVEGAKMLYDVTEEEIEALRQFVPEWSKNSTLVPIRDDNTGELKYMDFSHSNAYDLMARPFRTLALSINDAQQNDQTVLSGFARGVDDAVTELASPFVAESIWTEALGDLVGRGGITKDGRQLYTDETSFGDKKAIQFRHLLEALAPSYRQGVRLYQTATDTPTKTGQFLEGETLGINDQVLGFMGLRPIEVDPLRSMGFKIAEYQTGIRNARREFTGGFFGLLRGGPIDEDDVVNRYIASNRARFNVQKEMYKNINAAEVLGVKNVALRRTFSDRQISMDDFGRLQRGRFDPYFPSLDIISRFREIAKNLGDPDAYRGARTELMGLQRDFGGLDLGESFNQGGRVGFAQGSGSPITETEINSLLASLRSVRNDLRKLTLDDEFDFEMEEYIQPEQPQGQAQAPQTNLPPTPDVNPALVKQVLPSTNVMETGLTPTEQALLSNEEKAIRLRQRGMTS